MIIKAAIRYPDGKKNLIEVTNIASREDAVAFLKSELIDKTTILTLVNSNKPIIITDQISA